MKQPMPRGSSIGMKRMRGWVSVFSEYRHAVTEPRIDRWLDQFSQNDRDLAARILDCVEFITKEQMTSAFRSVLGRLGGWSKNEKSRRGKWRFVPFSGSSGESGDSMLYTFRLANGLNSRAFNSLFIYRSQLASENLGPDDTVVFVDDFAGTGRQACKAWRQDFEELLPGKPNTYLILAAASVAAREKIENETDLTVIPHIELFEEDRIFSYKCRHFTPTEKDSLLRYCRKGDKRNPKGYGECGYVIVFAHNCPNNTIPALHAHNQKWEGLFRRHD
jgi:hypothetical protein